MCGRGRGAVVEWDRSGIGEGGERWEGKGVGDGRSRVRERVMDEAGQGQGFLTRQGKGKGF